MNLFPNNYYKNLKAALPAIAGLSLKWLYHLLIQRWWEDLKIQNMLWLQWNRSFSNLGIDQLFKSRTY
jgi:hypothetical protein